MYKVYKKQGVEFLGFPCKQFGNKEQDNSLQIIDLLRDKYEIEFPIF